MELKPGFRIKMLTAIKAGRIVIPKDDVVVVAEIQKAGVVVQDILDNKVILPKNAKYKVISTTRKKVSLKGAVIPIGAIYEQEKRNLETAGPKIARTRSIQLAQVLVSNAISSEDPILLSRLALAGSILAMSLGTGIDNAQYSRLYQYARKLASS